MPESKRILVIAVIAAISSLTAAPAPAADGPVPLPVRKVVLYKNGMGYFEHLGNVRGTQSVEIVLPSTQLNDVLKSLTVIDLGKGQVGGVTYDSTAPLDKRLLELPIQLGSTEGLVGFLNQIRGASVEIRAPGGPITGRLMGAELRSRTSGPGATISYIEVTVFNPSGELRLVELESVGSLRFTDSALAGDLSRYLDLLDSSHQRDVRRLRVQTSGTGERQLYLSYTSEAPIWKTTYRLVLDSKQKPLLQAWAIVDNTTPMDWLDVALSLVSGAPVSFIQNLSQPIYARRPVVPLPQGVQVSPQLHEATLQHLSGDTGIGGSVADSFGKPLPGAEVVAVDSEGQEVDQAQSDQSGRYTLTLPAGRYRVEARLQGFRDQQMHNVTVQPGTISALNFRLLPSAGTIVEAEAPSIQTSVSESKLREERAPDQFSRRLRAAALPTSAPVGEVLRSQAPPTASTQALGEQFEYKLRQPVTIRRNESGLLPIIHTEIEGEKVSVYKESSGERHPRLAVWMKNTSGMVLDAGSFTVIDTSAFAGEGLTETIQPGESRLLSYALDLGVEVAANLGSERQRVDRIQISRGILRLHSKLLEKKTYVVRNNDEKIRTLVLEHPVRGGWTLLQTTAPAETSAAAYRFKIEARPKTTTELVVREENPQESAYAILNTSPEQIAVWVRERSIDPETEKALAGILAKKNETTELAQKSAALEREQNEIFRDQERVRGNLQRLGQTPDEASLRLRYIKQLEQQENRIASIRTERDRLETARQAAQKQLDEMIQNLSVDRKL